jgi:TolB-like protein
MNQPPNYLYEFGPFRLDTEDRVLLRDGRLVPLKPKVYDTLLALVRNNGHVVEKEKLMQEVWPTTFVEENNLTGNIFALRKAFDRHNFIETVPRRGYRFIADVRQVQVEGIDLSVQDIKINSLAVLPFINASADPNAEYLSDGIAESIINNLSRLPQLRVMASSGVSRYKNRTDDPQELGRELKVRTMLLGRVLQLGDRLIIRTSLVDAADGSQLWGQQYDRATTDILDTQEQIAREISETLRLKLSRDEQNLDAY